MLSPGTRLGGGHQHSTRRPEHRTRWVAGSLLATLALLLPAAALSQDAEAEALPAPGTALAAGRYVSSVVGPTIEFRVDDGWVVGPGSEGPIFTLERAEQPGTVLTVTRFDGDVFLDSCDPSSLSVVEATVPRLAEVIGGDPYLNPGPPRVTAVDGYGGIELDVATPAYEECDLPYVLVWALPIGDGGEFVQVADQQSRFIILDVEGDVVVIAAESFPGVPFGGILEAAMELVGSMRIEPAVPPASPPATAPEASPVASPNASPRVSVPASPVAAPSAESLPGTAAPEASRPPSHAPVP